MGVWQLKKLSLHAEYLIFIINSSQLIKKKSQLKRNLDSPNDNMATIHIASTAPINPPGATPVLTVPQVWAGLQRKIRHAEEFVPVITSCTVEKEDGNVITRRVVFDGAKEVTEVCTEHAPSRVHFRMDSGTEVQNVISRGASGGDEDLFMTYVFAWRLPGVEQGSEQMRVEEAKHQQVCRGS